MRPPAGLVHMAWSALWFSVMSLFVKLAGARLPAMEIVFLRGTMTLALSWWLVRRAGVALPGNRPALLALRGAIGFLALSCFYVAVVNLPLAEVTVVHYMHPLFAAVLAAWFLGERVERRVLVAIVVSLVGVVLIAKPGALFPGDVASGVEARYVPFALASAIGSAAAYVAVRGATRTDHPLLVVLYFPLVTVPLALPFAIASWVTPRGIEWLYLLAIGVTTQLGQVALTRGLALERTGRATTVGYVQVALAALWGWVVFADLPDRYSLLGIAAIAGGLLALPDSGDSTEKRGGPDGESGPPHPLGEVTGSLRGGAAKRPHEPVRLDVGEPVFRTPA